MPYVDVFKLMEYANNMADKSIDANDIARFTWANVQEVKHGRWSGDFCSVCGVSKYNFIKMRNDYDGYCGTWYFCPNCGAKMDGEDDGV